MKLHLFMLFLAASFLFSVGAPAVLLAQSAEGVYKTRIGSLEVTALSDAVGTMPFNLLLDVDPAKVKQSAADAAVKGSGFPSYVNAFVIKLPAGLVLLDTGNGPSANLAKNMAAAGISPSDVIAVLLTHFHGDHVSGLLDEKGKAAFPNAVVYADQKENDYWMGDAKRKALPKKVLAPYVAADRYKLFSPGDELFPGVSAVELYGHTPGHTGFFFKGGEQDLLVWGDIVHVRFVQFKYPEATMTYDVDTAGAAATRARIMAEAAEKGYFVAGAHLPFPAIGKVVKAGSGYDYQSIDE
ncbi:MAG: MBL fold metallo-hydrolase [Deltaproteobacteria bacterium]|jgi:glyoxylase-like metal-dependent hydrolase (beta-lactamase superfamily II)|nr:MBL fold metallo-hydrolase [Deltaproteobacteria bacterium]